MSGRIHCTQCGTALPADAMFCASCGARTMQVEAPTWTEPTLAYQPEPFKYGGFWLRLVASILDGIIVNLAISVIGAALASSADGGATVVGLLTLFGNWLYFALMEAGPWQATIGKRVLGLMVVDDHGRPISFGRATRRYWGKLVSTVILGIGFILAAFTSRKQALHDMMAGTLVVKRPTGFART
jgi:uncharacterized RDD family membrane protein YckC